MDSVRKKLYGATADGLVSGKEFEQQKKIKKYGRKILFSKKLAYICKRFTIIPKRIAIHS
jgi:hypothetical protein